jgi:hypothetical protein
MKQQIIVNNMPPNLNEYRNMHYRELDKQKKEWEKIVYWIVKEQKIKPVSGPIRLTYRFWFKDRREHDPDNYACCAKFLNDGLVSAGILQRDNFDHIPQFRVEQGGINKQPYIMIELEEIANESEVSA